jgi:hypothetical protein
MGRADDDLHIRILFPQSRNGLDSVPTGWHSHIDEGHCIGAPLFQSAADQLNALSSLRRAVNFKQRDTGALALRTEQGRLGGG